VNWDLQYRNVQRLCNQQNLHVKYPRWQMQWREHLTRRCAVKELHLAVNDERILCETRETCLETALRIPNVTHTKDAKRGVKPFHQKIAQLRTLIDDK
jgi:hypothetical protein